MFDGCYDEWNWQEGGERNSDAHLPPIDGYSVLPSIGHNPGIFFQVVDQDTQRNTPQEWDK
jgi:hypothetical protein